MLKAFILMAPQTSGLIINQFFLQILNIFKPIMPGVHKMVKLTLKFLLQVLKKCYRGLHLSCYREHTFGDLDGKHAFNSKTQYLYLSNVIQIQKNISNFISRKISFKKRYF